MNTALVDGIVKAVLYEGYMLYPYRPSATKNKQRFNFGVVYPRVYSHMQGDTDAWTMQTECIVLGPGYTYGQVSIRFLRVVDRSIKRVLTPSTEISAIKGHNVEQVESLEVEGRTYQPWQEMKEESIAAAEFNLSAVAAHPVQQSFVLSAMRKEEMILDGHGRIVGIIERRTEAITGTIDVAVEAVRQGVFKLRIRISNKSQMVSLDPSNRAQALARSMVSTHTILETRGGEFVSAIDPPNDYRDCAESCQNVGTWPVLVGEDGKRDVMLSSPIILYDYPQIAPESPGDLFDGAEIDEILSLRILTMTEEEKREMRQTDDRTSKILERTESMPQEQFMKLHGALRGLRATHGESR